MNTSFLKNRVQNSHLPQYIKNWFNEYINIVSFEQKISDLEGNTFEITNKIAEDCEYVICYNSFNKNFYFACIDEFENLKIHGISNNIIGILTYR